MESPLTFPPAITYPPPDSLLNFSNYLKFLVPSLPPKKDFPQKDQ